jgi:uncharacterized protein YcbK (DUF882 family)
MLSGPMPDRLPLIGDPAAPAEAPGRRRFLTGSGATAVALLLGRDAKAATAARRLSFVNTHTDETLSVVYWADGRYVPGALKDINFILRDFRTDAVRDIDPGLIDLVHALRTRLESNAPFHIISGYRTPETNKVLRERSGRVASHSLHCDGRAIDVRLPGTPLRSLQRVALALQGGGVGYYAASQFVHVDTGRVRSW